MLVSGAAQVKEAVRNELAAQRLAANTRKRAQTVADSSSDEDHDEREDPVPPIQVNSSNATEPVAQYATPPNSRVRSSFNPFLNRTRVEEVGIPPNDAAANAAKPAGPIDVPMDNQQSKTNEPEGVALGAFRQVRAMFAKRRQVDMKPIQIVHTGTVSD